MMWCWGQIRTFIMPSEEETKELMKDTSKRGQPIPPDIMEVAKGIDVDTKRSEFYAVDQDRDEHGRFADEGRGSGNAAMAHAELLTKEGGWFKLPIENGNFYGKEYPEGTVTVEMRPDRALEKPYSEDKSLHLAFIGVEKKNRGKGLASRALTELTNVADKHGVPITATIDPQGQGGLTKKQLTKWYEKHGFERQPYPMQPEKLSDAIIRKPRRK